jgi:hypothetical protein
MGRLVDTFGAKLRQWGLVPERGRMVRKPLKDFYSLSADKRQARFHIGLLPQFRKALEERFPHPGSVIFETVPLYEPDKVEHVINEKYKDRDHQIEAVKFLSQLPTREQPNIPRIKLLRFRTGRGKSYTSMRAVQETGTVFIAMVLATYLEKWAEDLERTYELGEGELVTVQGIAELKKVMLKKRKGEMEHVKGYVISMDTHKSWLKTYEFFLEDILSMGFECLPQDFYKFMGAGVRIMDEVHKQFHACYRQDLFTHVPLSISLSATLISRDPFLNARYAEAFPHICRYADDAAIIYAESQTVHYEFRKANFIRTTEFNSSMFSSNAFEVSVMKHIPTFERYLDMIATVAKDGFGHVKRGKKRLLILAYRVDMIDAIVTRMRKAFPELKVERYVSGSDWDNLVGSDIAVSNYGKAGTAVDIPDLTNLINTINMGAEHAVLQIFGRLRQLPDDHPVVMQSLVACNIPKSVEYDISRRKAFIGYAKIQKDRSFGFII